MKNECSARLSARFTLCSTSRTVVPSALTRRTMPIRSSTVFGASPSVSSSMISSRGRVSSTRASASICCSPPDSVPAGWSMRASSAGNAARASSMRVVRAGRSLRNENAARRRFSRTRERRERHLAADEQPARRALSTCSASSYVLVAPKRRIAPRCRMVEAGDRAQQRALARAVRAEQRGDLALRDLEVHVEQHLLGAVREVEVVDLQRGDGAARACGAAPPGSARARLRSRA